jgi:hypothetical protein
MITKGEGKSKLKKNTGDRRQKKTEVRDQHLRDQQKNSGEDGRMEYQRSEIRTSEPRKTGERQE